MRSDGTSKRHPGQQELMLHAEALVDGKTPPNPAVVVHVAKCAMCAAEVEAVSASLRVIAGAPLLEPSFKAQTALLMRARKERRTRDRVRRGGRGVLRVMRGMAYAAAILLVAALAFGAALGGVQDGRTAPGVAITPAQVAESQAVAQPADSMEETFATVRTLSNAVKRPVLSAPMSPAHLEQRRTVDALGADLAAAREALTRNPGCERASSVMNASLERQAETLRDLYVHGSL